MFVGIYVYANVERAAYPPEILGPKISFNFVI